MTKIYTSIRCLGDTDSAILEAKLLPLEVPAFWHSFVVNLEGGGSKIYETKKRPN